MVEVINCRDTPMDYDDSEFSIHNVELTEEGSSTVSPVLRPYDYEDAGHLSFDSLVENEVFLGITGQEDNQWIEEYSRGTSSGVVESRHDNVWSEAASSESVEMLLKSVGQGTLVTESSDEPGSLATNLDPILKQEDDSNHALEAMVTNQEEVGSLATEELGVSDEPGSLATHMDPNLNQDDEFNHALEAMVANKVEGFLATEELDVSDEPGSLSINLDPTLKQEDINNHAHEAMVTNKEEEGALATEELDVSDEPGCFFIHLYSNVKQEDVFYHSQEAMVTNKEGVLEAVELDVSDEPDSLSISLDPNLKQDDENNHAQEATVTEKGERVSATEELDVIDEPGSMATSMDPSLNQDDGNNHAIEAMVTNNKEEEVLATEESVVSDEPFSLSINLNPNLKQNDENDDAVEAMITNKEEEVVLATEELDVSDEPGSLATNTGPVLKQDDENNHAQEAMLTNKEEVGPLAIEELDASDEPGSFSVNTGPILKQDDENNHAQEALVTNKEEAGPLATEELDVSDEPDSFATNMDPNLKQDDHAQEAMVTNNEEGVLTTEELVWSDEPCSLATNMYPNLKQDDVNNHAHEAMVIDKEVRALVTEELDASDEAGSLATNMDPYLNQYDENNHAQEAVVTNNEEEVLPTEELVVNDEPGSLSLSMDPDLKQDDGNNHAQEAIVVDIAEEGVWVTEEFKVSYEPGSLAINMDSNLKQDDGNNHALEAMVIDKEVGALVTEELDASDEGGSFATNLDPYLNQDDENNHAQEAVVTNNEEEVLPAEELVVNDEPGSLSVSMNPDLKQDDGNNHAQEAIVIDKAEEGVWATEEFDVSYEPGCLAINMDSNLKQDDGNNHALEAMVADKEVGALVTEELDASDDPDKLTTNVGPNLKQDDGNSHAHEVTIINKPQESFNCDEFNVTVTKDSQEETEVSGGKLDSDVLVNIYDLSEEKVDGMCDDVNHEARNIADELSDNKLQEDLSTSKIECGNLDASKECDLKRCPSSNEAECSTKNTDNPVGSYTAVKTSTNSDVKPSNVDSLDKPPCAVDILVEEESMPAESCCLQMTEACAEVSHDSKCAATAFPEAYELNNDFMHEDLPPVSVEDDGKTTLENLASLESNACSPLEVSDAHVEESEKPDSAFDTSEMGEGSSINDTGTNMTNTCSSAELIAGNMDPVATLKVHSGDTDKDQSPAVKLSGSVQQQINDEVQSSEQHGGTLDMDAVALDSQQNIESVFSDEGCKAQGSEADITILAEPGYIDATSPILGVTGSVHHDNEKKEERFVSDGTCENESLKVASMVDCASLSVVKTGAYPDSAGEFVHETSVENMNDLAEQANPDDLGGCSTPSTVDSVLRDSSTKAGDNNEAGDGMQESISRHNVNMSSDRSVSTDVVLTSECNDSHMGRDEGSHVSMDKLQSLSPLFNTINTELSQSTVVKPSEGAIDENTSFSEPTEDVNPSEDTIDENTSFLEATEDVKPNEDAIDENTSLPEATEDLKPSEGGINENTSLSEATEHVVLTSECNDSHMGSEEDTSVFMDTVSSLLNTNNAEPSPSTRVEPSKGDIIENIQLPVATQDVIITSQCDDSHMRHEENTSLSMDTGVKPSEGSINKNTSLPEATEDLVLTLECEDSHMRHGEDTSVSMDTIQSASPLLNTNKTELSQSTRVMHSEGAINENTSLPEAAEHVMLISECDDSHMKHENSCVSMDKPDSVSLLLNTNNSELSQSTRVKSSEDAIDENTSLTEEAEEVVLSSERDDNHLIHEGDSSVSMNKLESVSPVINKNNTELSQSARVMPSEGINENTSLPEATEDVRAKEHSISSNSDMKTETNFTFEVSANASATAGLTETCKGMQLFLASQSMAMEGPCIDSSSTLDPIKPNASSVVTPQTPGSETTHTGTKERKRRRKSGSKESVEKGKETTTTQSRKVEKSSPLLVTSQQPTQPAASGQVIQFQELGPKEKVECSVTKPVSISNLPDLNNATSIFHQPFTNNQQVQLRAQILVYGSLISGMPPEEPHMIAAFEQSDAGRKTWEDAWRACLDRLHVQKSQANTPMQQPRADLKDVGYRSPDLGIKHSSILSSTYKGTPPAVSPLIPVPSPLWNMPTPSCVGFQSRNAAFQHPFTPIHHPSYQTTPNPLWLSQSPFLGQWGIASLPGSPAPRFSGSPITEAVKLTPVNVSGVGPHTHSIPVVHSALFSPLSNDGKKVSSDPKSRKRKKVNASDTSQVLMTAPSAHLIPRTGAHNRIPFLVEKQTDSDTAPVVTSIFSTSVTVSAPPASNSSSPARFLSVHDMLKKVEEGNVQEANVNATDPRSIKRTKITSSPAVNQTPVSVSTQKQTVSATVPAFCTSFPTPVSLSTPVSTTSYSSQNMENALAVDETLSKVKESKLQAENAALLASAEVSNCQNVWSGLNGQNSSGVVSDAEAKLMSSVSAAATVAKMASAAAKFASNIAEQAALMADEVFQSSKNENFCHISHPNVVNKATPASILKSMDIKTDSHPNLIISAAREAARRRIEAASAASKHAENLDAIVKAAELAAEAVSQVGNIVAMGDSSALRKFAKAGPEGFWKISQLSYEQHLTSNSSKRNLSDKVVKEIKTLKHDLASNVHLAHNQMKTVINDGSVISIEKDTRTSKVPNLSKVVGVSTETNTRSPHTYIVGHVIPQNTPGVWEEHNIKEGCLVEVCKENGKYKGAWLAANVLSLKDEKALICYTGIKSSDEGSENVKEWVAFEVKGSEEVPRIRIAHPMTTMRFEGTRKRGRTAVTDYAWSKGDRVDVWMQDCWREGIVLEPNKIDVTTLTVQFPAQGETSVVRSWHVRPTLIWKDRCWIEWNGIHTSQGELPKEKRMKLGSPTAVIDKRKDKLPIIVESGTIEEQGTLLPLLSSQETCFNVGKNTNKPTSNHPTILKDKARVVFGVPKPGKKQKFMAVSTQYVDDRTNKNITTNSSNSLLKFPKPSGVRVAKTDAMENQVAETKSRIKPRKPPIPWFRTITNCDPDSTDADSVENSSSRQNQTQVGSSSNKRKEPPKVPPTKKAFAFTSKPKSDPPFKGRKLPPPPPKTEVKDKSDSQVNEPRRSNRKIQPTSRLLEGLQSSLTVSKIPSVSHAGQRKVTSKGNSSHGSTS